MNQQYCCYCGHFRQHYTLSDGKLVKVYCGTVPFSPPLNENVLMTRFAITLFLSLRMQKTLCRKNILQKRFCGGFWSFLCCPRYKTPPAIQKTRTLPNEASLILFAYSFIVMQALQLIPKENHYKHEEHQYRSGVGDGGEHGGGHEGGVQL